MKDEFDILGNNLILPSQLDEMFDCSLQPFMSSACLKRGCRGSLFSTRHHAQLTGCLKRRQTCHQKTEVQAFLSSINLEPDWKKLLLLMSQEWQSPDGGEGRKW